jgi:hypothetical protein
MHRLKLNTQVQVIPYSIAVFYFGRLIALVDERGAVIWRDPNYPLFLVEYLIEYPYLETGKWN